MQCCCRFHLLLEELRRCNPQVAGMSAHVLKTQSTSEVIRQALDKLTARPNIAFVCYSEEWSAQWVNAVEDMLPPDTKMIAAGAQITQTISDGVIAAPDEDFSLLLGSFPEAVFAPFSIDLTDSDGDDDLYSIVDKALKAHGEQPPSFWKAFVLHCNEPGSAHHIAKTIQDRHPDAAVIGGICESVAIRTCEREEVKMPDLDSCGVDALKLIILEEFGTDFLTASLKDPTFDLVACAKKIFANRCSPSKVKLLEAGIVGVALGGNVPLRSIVSRGVKPLSNRSVTINQIEPLGQQVTMVTHVEDGVSISPAMKWLRECCEATQESPQFVGLKRRGERGFTLSGVHRAMLSPRGMVIDAENLAGAQLQLYTLDSDACMRDVDHMMKRLLAEVEANQEELLGALMFSCAGRGPKPTSIVRAHMMDAAAFHVALPTLPLVGFYAGGEIGPMAMAEVEEGAAQFGKATLQGFTVVFGVFVKPVSRQVATFFENLDDAGARAAYTRSQASSKRKVPPSDVSNSCF